MAMSQLYRFYRDTFLCGSSRWFHWMNTRQKMALLEQVTQWRIGELSEEEYRHWL